MSKYQVFKFILTNSDQYRITIMDKIRMFFGQRIFFFGQLFEEGDKERVHFTYKSFSLEDAYNFAEETILRDIHGKTFMIDELQTCRKHPFSKVWSSLNRVELEKNKA